MTETVSDAKSDPLMEALQEELLDAVGVFFEKRALLPDRVYAQDTKKFKNMTIGAVDQETQELMVVQAFCCAPEHAETVYELMHMLASSMSAIVITDDQSIIRKPTTH